MQEAMNIGLCSNVMRMQLVKAVSVDIQSVFKSTSDKQLAGNHAVAWALRIGIREHAIIVLPYSHIANSNEDTLYVARVQATGLLKQITVEHKEAACHFVI